MHICHFCLCDRLATTGACCLCAGLGDGLLGLGFWGQLRLLPCEQQICIISDAVIGSPHCLNSEFAFYTHSEHYLNITTHFRILFRIFGAHSTSSQLIRTSEAHFGNFGPILDLRSLFWKLRIYFGPPKIISETSHLQNLYSHLRISSDHSSGPYTSPLTLFHHCSYSVSHVDMF
jgi:hypothetical protein